MQPNCLSSARAFAVPSGPLSGEPAWLVAMETRRRASASPAPSSWASLENQLAFIMRSERQISSDHLIGSKMAGQVDPFEDFEEILASGGKSGISSNRPRTASIRRRSGRELAPSKIAEPRQQQQSNSRQQVQQQQQQTDTLSEISEELSVDWREEPARVGSADFGATGADSDEFEPEQVGEPESSPRPDPVAFKSSRPISSFVNLVSDLELSSSSSERSERSAGEGGGGATLAPGNEEFNKVAAPMADSSSLVAPAASDKSNFITAQRKSNSNNRRRVLVIDDADGGANRAPPLERRTGIDADDDLDAEGRRSRQQLGAGEFISSLENNLIIKLEEKFSILMEQILSKLYGIDNNGPPSSSRNNPAEKNGAARADLANNLPANKPSWPFATANGHDPAGRNAIQAELLESLKEEILRELGHSAADSRILKKTQTNQNSNLAGVEDNRKRELKFTTGAQTKQTDFITIKESIASNSEELNRLSRRQGARFDATEMKDYRRRRRHRHRRRQRRPPFNQSDELLLENESGRPIGAGSQSYQLDADLGKFKENKITQTDDGDEFKGLLDYYERRQSHFNELLLINSMEFKDQLWAGNMAAATKASQQRTANLNCSPIGDETQLNMAKFKRRANLLLWSIQNSSKQLARSRTSLAAAAAASRPQCL